MLAPQLARCVFYFGRLGGRASVNFVKAGRVKV